MLRAEENEKLCRVGPGTPMGELMRWYWHPIAAVAQLNENPVRKVRLLGEDLVLYRDAAGGYGLVQAQCPHRSMGLQFGIPEPEGLRCAYHGWLFDGAGRCLETPLEPADSSFHERVRVTAYPVQELGGLLFAYLGPQPAPLLPRWDVYAYPNALRQIGITVIPCNWLQCVENALDLTHDTYLHGHFFKYTLERLGLLAERAPDPTLHRSFSSMRRRLSYLEHKVTDYGVQKYARREGDPDGMIARGPYVVFPYHTRPGSGIRTDWQARVPIDDTHTLNISYQVYVAPPRIEIQQQDVVPYYDIPLFDDKGEPILDYVLGQDLAAWWSQGEIADRSKEKLGQTDAGIILFRRLLKEQLNRIEDGGEPMNVFRDPTQNDIIHLDPRLDEMLGAINFRSFYHKGYYKDDVDRYGPLLEEVKDLMRRVEEAGIEQQRRSVSFR